MTKEGMIIILKQMAVRDLMRGGKEYKELKEVVWFLEAEHTKLIEQARGLLQ